jgi:L-alanine-DL-glutamate epimerase-like enolase superfamily enzyme
LALSAAVRLMASIISNEPWMLFRVGYFWDGIRQRSMATDLLKNSNSLQLTDGVFPVPKGVGIGVEVDEEAIKHYLIE